MLLLTFPDLCSHLTYAVVLILHYNGAAGTLWPQIRTLNRAVCHH